MFRRFSIWSFILVAVGITLSLATCYVLFSHGTAQFSDDFLQRFDFSLINTPESREKASASNYYRLGSENTIDGILYSWDLYLPRSDEYIMEMQLHEYTPAEPEVKDTTLYSIKWKRVSYYPGWWSSQSSFFSNVKKARFFCEATLSSMGGYVYFAVYGDSIDMCVQKIEDYLLQIISDLS